jgi:hypothetical protein
MAAPRGKKKARTGWQKPLLYSKQNKYWIEGQWGEYRILGEEGLYFLGGDQKKSLQGWDNPQPQRLTRRASVTNLVVEKGADSGFTLPCSLTIECYSIS